MLSFRRICQFDSRAGRNGASCAALLFALAAGGCSADVSRFDLGSYALNDSGGAKTGSASSSRGLGAGASDDFSSRSARNEPNSSSSFDSPRPPRQADLRSAPLPDLAPPPAQRRAIAPRILNTQTQSPPPRRVAALAPQSAASGQTITVVRGDTIYALSRKHGVSISALLGANGLSNPTIRPGQKLVIPGAGSQGGELRPERRTVAAPKPRAAPARVAADVGNYTVKPGDSLYRIARKYGLRTAALKAANPSVDPRRMRPGQMLVIPGNNAPASGSNTIIAAAPQRPAKTAPAVTLPPRVVSTVRADDRKSNPGNVVSPRIINGADNRGNDTKRVASLEPASASDAGALPEPQKRSSAGNFRWPAKGKVIVGFGARSDGTHNDGVNVAVPMGTPIKAAENGVVAYAGSELKGYGNLVLVRHDNNWVTAYAHADSLMVRRGDKVRRGQVIAKAGKTGTVDQPQLHFELRQGSKPVDPIPHLN